MASRPVIALGLYAFAMAMIPLNDALIKLMSGHLSIFQILAMRSVISLGIVFAIPGVLFATLRLRLATLLKLSLRGACLVGAMLCFFLPLATLSLAEVTAIFFTAPLIITLLSVPVLGEKLGVYRIGAVLIGLAGVLIIVKPAGSGFQHTYLIPIGSAVYYAVFQIITRFIRNEAPVPVMVAVQNVIYLLTGIIGIALVMLLRPEIGDSPIDAFLLRPLTQPEPFHYLYLVICGFIVLGLAFASTNAYANVEATLVSPFEYVALPMAVFWGIMLWGDWPDFEAWIGILLILGSGIVLIYRESVRDVDLASSTPMRASVANAVNASEENTQPVRTSS